jgi:hypothetical protein
MEKRKQINIFNLNPRADVKEYYTELADTKGVRLNQEVAKDLEQLYDIKKRLAAFAAGTDKSGKSPEMLIAELVMKDSDYDALEAENEELKADLRAVERLAEKLASS